MTKKKKAQLKILPGTKDIKLLPYQSVLPGGKVTVEQLQIMTVCVENLPSELDGIVMSSDLQGVGFDYGNGGAPLPGEIAAGYLHDAMTSGRLLMSPERTGVMLAGDLYATGDPGSRGCSGDPTPVWLAFSSRFRWVVGVHGNHDLFPGNDEGKISRCKNVHALDGETISVDGLTLGGIGGIIGKPGKPRRRSESEYLSILDALACSDLDVLLTHCGPDTTHGFMGDARIQETLDSRDVPLHVFGHCPWPEPLTVVSGTQLLNVDGRVVVFERAS
ncbi:MAG: metallophosphoesterase [Candidatus Thiodiazotropha sp. DIVDIV]